MNIFAYANGFEIFGLTIYFYAFCILGGALVALFLSNYRAHKDGYPWDMFNSIFLVALPSGIIGARLWYVIAEWERFTDNFADIFAFRDGGLAIQGGVICGAIAGIIYVYFRRKDMDVLRCADFAVPTILVAQAIGRWGNFFNQEVYGNIVDMSSWWLPSFIQSNMVVDGAYHVPLFFLEGIVNLGGYFVITRFIPFVFGKHYCYGDQTFAYFAYYGLVRLVLEPLRDAKYQMGMIQADSLRAVGMAIAFIVVGIVLIIVNHIVRFYLKQKKAGDLKKNG